MIQTDGNTKRQTLRQRVKKIVIHKEIQKDTERQRYRKRKERHRINLTQRQMQLLLL